MLFLIFHCSDFYLFAKQKHPSNFKVQNADALDSPRWQSHARVRGSMQVYARQGGGPMNHYIQRINQYTEAFLSFHFVPRATVADTQPLLITHYLILTLCSHDALGQMPGELFVSVAALFEVVQTNSNPISCIQFAVRHRWQRQESGRQRHASGQGQGQVQTCSTVEAKESSISRPSHQCTLRVSINRARFLAHPRFALRARVYH